MQALKVWRATEALDAAGAPPSDSSAQLRRQTELLRNEIQRLLLAIANRGAVDQASGVLALHCAADAQQALDILTDWSQRCDVDVHTVADTLVNGVCRGDTSGAYDACLVRWLEQQMRRPDHARLGAGATSTA